MILAKRDHWPEQQYIKALLSLFLTWSKSAKQSGAKAKH